MANSQNGWPVINDEDGTRAWCIPGTGRTIRLKRGPAGFVLAVTALWFHEEVEPISGGTWDEWGWAVRSIRGSTEISNHASGTAMDLNAVQHPLGVDGTYSRAQIRKVHKRLRWMGGVVRWGQDYSGRKDGMHFEINAGRKAVTRLAKVLAQTKRGQAVRKANPVQN